MAKNSLLNIETFNEICLRERGEQFSADDFVSGLNGGNEE